MDKNRLKEIRSVVLDMDNDDPINEVRAVYKDAITYGELGCLLEERNEYKERAIKAESEIENWRGCYETRKSEIEGLRKQVEWLEANSVIRNPRQHPISEYLETKDEPEPVCPGSEIGVHSEAWYDGEQCSICGAPCELDHISAVLREVWRLPKRWRNEATENEHIGNHAAAYRFKCCADELECALFTSTDKRDKNIRQVGCEGLDGLLRVHSEDEYCDVCRYLEDK